MNSQSRVLRSRAAVLIAVTLSLLAVVAAATVVSASQDEDTYIE